MNLWTKKNFQEIITDRGLVGVGGEGRRRDMLEYSFMLWKTKVQIPAPSDLEHKPELWSPAGKPCPLTPPGYWLL